MPTTTIAAAGGVVWRASASGLRVAVIHRPHRNDWSLPKGKLRSGERPLLAGYREVIEETGLDVVPQQNIGRVRYRIASSPKTVSYWAMRHMSGQFVANDEADQMRWLTPDAAREILTFPGDRSMVTRFAAGPQADSAVLLVRHARAGKRGTWKKDDQLRPIDRAGQRQAAAIADMAALFVPRRIVAATPVRCQQTVLPLAERLGLSVGAAPEYSDADFERHPKRAMASLLALSRRRGVSVVASQGGTIPGLLDRLRPAGAPHVSRKGSVWALFYREGELLSADYYEHP